MELPLPRSAEWIRIVEPINEALATKLLGLEWLEVDLLSEMYERLCQYSTQNTGDLFSALCGSDISDGTQTKINELFEEPNARLASAIQQYSGVQSGMFTAEVRYCLKPPDWGARTHRAYSNVREPLLRYIELMFYPKAEIQMADGDIRSDPRPMEVYSRVRFIPCTYAQMMSLAGEAQPETEGVMAEDRTSSTYPSCLAIAGTPSSGSNPAVGNFTVDPYTIRPFGTVDQTGSKTLLLAFDEMKQLVSAKLVDTNTYRSNQVESLEMFLCEMGDRLTDLYHLSH